VILKDENSDLLLNIVDWISGEQNLLPELNVYELEDTIIIEEETERKGDE
jgi:hypothetical protein